MTVLANADLVAPISATVRALLAGHEMRVVDLADALAIPRTTLYRRLQRHDWTAHEVALIAAFFDRTAQDLYDGNAGFVMEPRVGIEPTAVRLHCRRPEPFAVQPLDPSAKMAA